MKYVIWEYHDNLHITWESGLLSASLTEWNSSRVRSMIWRDLKEGERFYWLNKIFNRSDKKWEGTQLLLFVIKMLEQRNATIWLIPSPDLPGWDEVISRVSIEERLKQWYIRHGFEDIWSHYNLLLRKCSPKLNLE